MSGVDPSFDGKMATVRNGSKADAATVFVLPPTTGTGTSKTVFGCAIQAESSVYTILKARAEYGAPVLGSLNWLQTPYGNGAGQRIVRNHQATCYRPSKSFVVERVKQQN